MTCRLAILGSTGSVGRSTLEVVALHRSQLEVVALAAGRNAALLMEQARRFRPRLIVLEREVDLDPLRPLARELGARLGCGGLLQSLRRTRIGELDVSGAHTVPSDADPDWVRERLTAPSEMALEPPPTRLDSAADVASFRQGQKRRWEGANPPDGWLRVLDPEGQLLGLASVADGLLQPRVVLPG